MLHPLPLPLSSCLGCIPPLIGLPSLRFYAVGSSLFLLSVCFCLCSLFYRDDVLCWLLLARPFLYAFHAHLRFPVDLVWFRLSCDHGWIRSGSVNVRKQQQRCCLWCRYRYRLHRLPPNNENQIDKKKHGRAERKTISKAKTHTDIHTLVTHFCETKIILGSTRFEHAEYNSTRSRMPMLPDHARPECRMWVAIVSLAIPLATEENRQPLPSRTNRDEQQVTIFVPLARPKWRNSPIIQRWCISQTRRRLIE